MGKIDYWLITSKIDRNAILALENGPVLIFCSRNLAENHIIKTNLPEVNYVKMDKSELINKFGEDCFVILDPEKPIRIEKAVPAWSLQENYH